MVCYSICCKLFILFLHNISILPIVFILVQRLCMLYLQYFFNLIATLLRKFYTLSKSIHFAQQNTACQWCICCVFTEFALMGYTNPQTVKCFLPFRFVLMPNCQVFIEIPSKNMPFVPLGPFTPWKRFQSFSCNIKKFLGIVIAIKSYHLNSKINRNISLYLN